MFPKTSTPAPPPPPPPPPNPPTYASSIFAPPTSTAGQIGGIFTGAMSPNPFGPADQNAARRKTLFGQ